MFICNISLNKSKIFKIFLYIFIAILIMAVIFGIYSFINKSKRNFVDDTIQTANILEINSENYTSILKSSHENIELFLNKTIKFSGFVYRLYDFKDNEFVLGREMIISQNTQNKNQAQVVVVGFLCDYTDANVFDDGTWVEIEGIISKGYYHSEIPIVKVNTITKTTAPENPYVYPPNAGYIKVENI